MIKLDPKSVNLWEQVSERTWGRYLTSVERRAVDHAASLFSTPGCALEVGAESGRWSRLFIEKGWAMECTEICPEKVTLCRENNPTAKCYLVDPSDTELPVGGDSVDLLMAIECPFTAESWFILEAERVLRKRGVLVVTHFNRTSWRGILDARKKSERHYLKSHREFIAELMSRGFSICRTEGFAWMPFSRLSNVRAATVCGAAEKALGLTKLRSLSPWVTVVAQRQQ